MYSKRNIIELDKTESSPRKICKIETFEKNIDSDTHIASLMKLYPICDEPTYLEKQNPHILDISIRFVEDTHTYFVNFDNDGIESNYSSDGILSTSGVVHKYFDEFNPDIAIEKMRNGRKWNRENKYYNMSNCEIKQMWVTNGEMASANGTWLHGQLERYMNGIQFNDDIIGLIPIKQFNKWYDRFFKDILIPFRTEFRFRSGSDLKLTGTADLIAIDKNHPPPDECDETLSLHIIDWKFSKAIKMKNPYQSGVGCCSSLDDTNYSHYLLQQNIYKYMMETFYPSWNWNGFKYKHVKVVSMKLCVFHENHGKEGFIVDLPDCRDIVERMMDDRRKTVSQLH